MSKIKNCENCALKFECDSRYIPEFAGDDVCRKYSSNVNRAKKDRSLSGVSYTPENKE